MTNKSDHDGLKVENQDPIVGGGGTSLTICYERVKCPVDHHTTSMKKSFLVETVLVEIIVKLLIPQQYRIIYVSFNFPRDKFAKFLEK